MTARALLAVLAGLAFLSLALLGGRSPRAALTSHSQLHVNAVLP